MINVVNGIIQGNNIAGVPFRAQIVKRVNGNVRTGASMPKILGPTVHTVGNMSPGADAEMHARYLQNVENAGTTYVGWHFTVGDDIIIQHLPITEHGWHAGDGASGTGNRQTIGVELIEIGDYAKTERNAILFLAELTNYLQSMGQGHRIYKHQDWSGKWCPRMILGDSRYAGTNRWSTFVRDIERQRGLHTEPTGEKELSWTERMRKDLVDAKVAADRDWDKPLTKDQFGSMLYAAKVLGYFGSTAQTPAPVPEDPKKVFSIGERVRFKNPNASLTYAGASTGVPIPTSVKKGTYTVEQIIGAGDSQILLLKEIVSWVYAKDME